MAMLAYWTVQDDCVGTVNRSVVGGVENGLEFEVAWRLSSFEFISASARVAEQHLVGFVDC